MMASEAVREGRGILFDFFGVICSEISPFWLQRYFPSEEANDLKATIVAAADCGELTEDELFAELGTRAAVSPGQVLREWQEYITIDAGVVAYIDGLRENEGRRIGLLSNSPSRFLRSILRDHDLERLFDDIVISSEAGIAKPAPAIFSMALERLNTRPSNTTFIDDNPVNVEAANYAGLTGILYTSLQALKIDLAERDRHAPPL